MSRYDHGVGPQPGTGLPRDLDEGARIAAAVLSDLMADWSPEDRADALDALQQDLAEGGRISLYFGAEPDGGRP